MESRESPTSQSAIIATPGTVSMLAFLRLKQLEFPLELLSATDATPTEAHGPEPVCILIPTSALRLSLYSEGTPSHQRALDIVVHDLISEEK